MPEIVAGPEIVAKIVGVFKTLRFLSAAIASERNAVVRGDDCGLQLRAGRDTPLVLVQFSISAK
jgi:hypothetical protein